MREEKQFLHSKTVRRQEYKTNRDYAIDLQTKNRRQFHKEFVAQPLLAVPSSYLNIHTACSSDTGKQPSIYLCIQFVIILMLQ